MNSHCLAKWLGQTHFWMGPNLWLCQRTFLLSEEAAVHLLLNTPCCGLSSESPTLVLLREPPSGSAVVYAVFLQIRKGNLPFTFILLRIGSSFCGHMIHPQFREACYSDGPYHSSEKPVTMMVPFPLSSSSVTLSPHFNYQ